LSPRVVSDIGPSLFGDLCSKIIVGPTLYQNLIVRHSKALGGISRITFQMNAASLPPAKVMEAIELIGTRVASALREGAVANTGRDD
jgi:hypothetical protein